MFGAITLGLALASQDFGLPNPWKDPGFAKLIFVQSPNFDTRPADAVIDTVVVHSTAGPTLEGTVKWFFTTESKVSAHFTIGKDGSIVEHVMPFYRAWHAGKSNFMGRDNVNHFSVGIELVNLNDGKDAYPEQQVQALKFVIGMLKRRLPIKYITSHEFIAQPAGRKSDPAAFDWKPLEDLGLQIVVK